jgi:hypothetical protein
MEPSAPFSSFLLQHANTFATQVTSLLQPSPNAEMHMVLSTAKEEHIFIFDKRMTPPTPSMVASTALHVAPTTVIGTPLHHKEEQMIVFEMEMITPVCLFVHCCLMVLWLLSMV